MIDDCEIEEFLDLIDDSGDQDSCWEWQGGRRKRSYGSYKAHNGKSYVASRIVWELFNGPIPEGMEVCHTCDNPPCCNPGHLFVGTRKDNIRDAMNKGRFLNEKHKNAIIAYMKNRIVSDETRRRMSLARKGVSRPMSEKLKKILKENPPMLGKHHSDETRRKISLAHKGKGGWHLTDEHKRKIGDANRGNKPMLGRHHSDETRQKMSESQTKRWLVRRSLHKAET